MTYNLHPLFVHFPIALLVVYSFIKILPMAKFFPRVAWNHIERFLLVAGIAGGSLALFTGEIAEELVNPDRKLVETHEFFANLSIWLYGVLLAGEILSFLNLQYVYVLKLKNLLMNRVFSGIVALIALGSITITGILGGVMVYGTSADPLAGILLKLFGIDF